jgi:DNA polymerase I-like protein with 3'-5' exonuclease and polymerase domains
MRTLFFDVETNPIEDFTNLTDLHTVHCLSVYDPMTPKMVTFAGDSIHRGLTALAEADRIVGHNVIKFDIPALKKLYGFSPPLVKVVDTLVLSRCIFSDLRNEDFGRNNFDPKLVGSHSLKAWGHRMGKATKLTYGEEDGAFDHYNEEMKKYCERDCIVTQLLYDYLLTQEPSNQMIAIEHWFAFIISQQERHGFSFDLDKADRLTAKLTSIRAELKDELQQMVAPKVEEMKSPAGWTLKIESEDQVEILSAETKVKLKEQLKARGLKQTLLKEAKKQGNKQKTTLFNPGSRQQIAAALADLGYDLPKEPDATTPKVDEGVLKKIDHPIAQKLLDYLLVQKRLGQLAEGEQAWLKLAKKGRIHGSVNTNGAVTGRCTHSNPNVAQVPACRVPYGEECRGLFGAGVGKKLVGCDASGLELRMLAHYLAFYDGGEYGKIVTEGDIHTANQQAAGLETRDQAKTFIYAFLYGAGDAKIGDIVGGTAREGQMLKRKFLSNLPALNRLQQDIKRKVENGGTLMGLDGRLLRIRSSHAALNMLLQSAGAVCMKVALIQLYHALGKSKWQHGREYAFVANIHDEFQAEVIPQHAEDFGKLAVKAIRVAGKELKLNVQLDGEYKVGTTWAETH